MRTSVALVILGLTGSGMRSASPPVVEPVRVCDVLRNLDQYRGKAVAVVGRYSFRTNGRYLGEAACEASANGPAAAQPPMLRLALDSKDAPRLPDPFDLDGAAADRQLRQVRKATSLGKFRFGSLDYDRWAIVWGRVEGPAEGSAGPALPRLLYRGDGLIFFITGE